jgi:hypothetical protein
MIFVDVSQLQAFEKQLQTFAARALPFATRQTLNTAVYEARLAYQGQMRHELTLRNTWTEGSAKFEPTRTLDISRQQARVGSVLEYMALQESGGYEHGKEGKSKPVPTAFARVSGQRSRMVKQANRLRAIALAAKGYQGQSVKQRIVVAVRVAVQTGRRDVYLDLGATKGIYRVVGGANDGRKRGWIRGAKLRKLWDMSRSAVQVPRHALLSVATNATADKLPAYYRDALVVQLRRHKLMGYA